MVGAGLFPRCRGRSICSIVSVSGAVSDVGRAVSGRPRLLAWAIVFVQSCAFPFTLVRSLPAWRLVAAVRLATRSPVPCVSSGRRCGGGRLSACLYSVAACDVVHLVPSRFSSVRYGERGGWVSGVSSCLLGVGVGVDVRRPVPVLVSRAIARCPCLSMRGAVGWDEADGGGWALSGSGVACLPFRLAPLFDKGNREGGGTNDDERLGDAMGDAWFRLMRGHSDEMMRNDRAEEVSCFRCPIISVFLSFLFSSLCPHLFDSSRLGCLLACPVRGVG